MFGDFLEFNLHGHILVTDGCFYGYKECYVLPSPGVEKAGGHLPTQNDIDVRYLPFFHEPYPLSQIQSDANVIRLNALNPV